MSDITLLTASPPVYRAIRLEQVLPQKVRRVLLGTSALLALGALWAFIITLILTRLNEGFLYANNTQLFVGLSLFFGGCTLVFMLLDFYARSVSRPSAFLSDGAQDRDGFYKLDVEGARTLFRLKALKRETVNYAHAYAVFRKSSLALHLILRLGLDALEFREFAVKGERRVLEIPRQKLLTSLAKIAQEMDSDIISAKECAVLLFDLDKEFEEFLFARKIHRHEFIGAASWAARSAGRESARERWWEKTVLGNIPGVGKDLGFGRTRTLDQYSHDLVPDFNDPSIHFMAHKKEMMALEEILTRSSEANVVLVGEPGAGKHAILKELSREIHKGTVSPALEHKRMIMLDTAAITASAKTKGKFEELLINLLNEASRAGNIVLVIEDVPTFLGSSQSLGADSTSLMEPYLSGSAIQVIVLSDIDSFNRVILPNTKLMKQFEKLEVAEPSLDKTLLILEDVAEGLEVHSNVIATYQGVSAVVDLSDRYVTQGVFPEKAVDLLEDAFVSATSSGKKFLMPEDAEAVVEREYHVPIANAGGEESQKLLHFEEIMHERIVNQNEAIHAVANALRKARSGLHAGNRPIASFLFLGPTGVGKTETAKVVSELYFGSVESMTRFDMSEFRGSEGAEKLLGSFTTREPGVLANKLREKPFGLLLFDEFEKSSHEVINLFLQILEEGFFTDSFGKKVSARETILIATSNAGSNLIWDLVQKGRDPASVQKEVIDHIRSEDIFSPELLNRFDAIVVYHPLNKEQLTQVARLILNELAAHLKEKDITFEVTDELAAKVVELGYDPVMGARPMRRAVADRVEQVIARRILEGKLERGSVFTLHPNDLTTE